jgi:hypothetical protein
VKLPEIHGYAIASDDDRIADAGGAMPKALHNEADWAYFQAELDRSDLIAYSREARVDWKRASTAGGGTRKRRLGPKS